MLVSRKGQSCQNCVQQKVNGTLHFTWFFHCEKRPSVVECVADTRLSDNSFEILFHVAWFAIPFTSKMCLIWMGHKGDFSNAREMLSFSFFGMKLSRNLYLATKSCKLWDVSRKKSLTFLSFKLNLFIIVFLSFSASKQISGAPHNSIGQENCSPGFHHWNMK